MSLVRSRRRELLVLAVAMLESCAASAGDSRPALSSRRNSFGARGGNFVDVPLPLEPLAPLQPLDGWHASPPMPGQIKVRRGAGFNRQAQLVASGDAKGYQQPSTSHALSLIHISEPTRPY